MAYYRCANIESCDFAKSGRMFSEADLPTVCPGCGKSFFVREEPSRSGLSGWLISSIGILVILSITVLPMWKFDMNSVAPPMPVPSSMEPPDFPIPPLTIPRESAVDQVLDQLNLGNIAFNAPHTMEMDKTENIQLVLSLDQSIEELKSTIQALGIKEGANIKVSDRMEASLTGLAFDIVPITPKEQAIASKGITSWEWQVVPKKEGTQWLYLSLTAHFEVDGKDMMRSVKTFDKVIEVEVTPLQKASQFIKGNWQWLWATFIAPLGFWQWKSRAKNKKAGSKERRKGR